MVRGGLGVPTSVCVLFLLPNIEVSPPPRLQTYKNVPTLITRNDSQVVGSISQGTTMLHLQARIVILVGHRACRGRP